MKVSVIMCVHNTPVEYLKTATESILNQTYEDIELVMVDDASDDATVIGYLNEVSSSADNVVLIKNTSNLGLTKSLNVALSACNGEYIARMDSDDYSYPDRIKAQVEYLNTHPDICLVGCQIKLFSENVDEARSSSYYAVYKNRDIYEIAMLFDHFGPAHPSFMFRGSFLRDNDIHYREDILKAQDYAIKADCIMHGGHIAIMDDELLAYRVHPGQISSTSSDEQKKYHRVTSSRCLAFYYPDLSESELEVLSTMLIGEYTTQYSAREYVNAIRHLIKLNRENKVFDAELFEDIVYSYYANKAVFAAGNYRKYSYLLSTLWCGGRLKTYKKYFTLVFRSKCI